MSTSKIKNNLLELRKNLGLSQKQLAEKIGISVNAITNIENGKNQMSIGIALILSNEFNVSLDWLYSKSEEKSIIKSETFASHLEFSTLTVPYNDKNFLIEKNFITLKLPKFVAEYYIKIAEIEKINKEQNLPEEAYNAWKNSVKTKFLSQLKSDENDIIEYILLEKGKDFTKELLELSIARNQLPDCRSKLEFDKLNNNF